MRGGFQSRHAQAHRASGIASIFRRENSALQHCIKCDFLIADDPEIAQAMLIHCGYTAHASLGRHPATMNTGIAGVCFGVTK
ncbi:MAG: hypothetical protein ABL985_06510 [Casimicrobium sp.]